MEIKLSNNTPSNIAVGSARGCYSSKQVTPEAVANWDGKNGLLNELFLSGHHTTMQHSTMTIEIKDMSRLLVWRLLHSHTHYNSDQVSQRYAKIKPNEGTYFYPKSINKAISDHLFFTAFETYEKLTEILTKDFEKSENPVEAKMANKKAMELARYVLPQAVTAHLYHSINVITALRYIAGSKVIPEGDTEALEFAEMLKAKIIEWDPAYEMLIEDVEKQKIEFPEIDMNKFPKIHKGKKVAVFDISSGLGYSSLKNHAYGINISSLFHPIELMDGFKVRMKISLSADAQNQRHRMSPGVRPDLVAYYKENYLEKSWEDFSDIFYIPEKIMENQEAFDLYVGFLESNRLLINKLFASDDINKKDIPYFYPNALMFELIEKNDFSNFAHKAKLRTCLNAQEEIRILTEEIIDTLIGHDVEEAAEFVPPCVSRFRNNVRPICSEGKRFCGIKVWKREKYNI
jgi:flavin-dependent thymidylate synthase